MFWIGGEVVPKMLEGSPLAAFDQRQRHFAVEMEVPQIAHQPDVFPITDAGQEGVHKHKALGLLRELRGVSVGDHQPDVVTNDARALESQRRNKRVNIHGHALFVVAGFRFG